jgi:hypothetical protein
LPLLALPTVESKKLNKFSSNPCLLPSTNSYPPLSIKKGIFEELTDTLKKTASSIEHDVKDLPNSIRAIGAKVYLK